MARQKGTANFSGTLEVLAGGPIDSRTVVPTKADLTIATNFPYAYVGMETYVTAENKKYRLINADVTQASSWEEVGSGSEITVDDEMSSSSTNPVQNKVITAALGNKVDAVSGKGLSANDYTDGDKAIVGGVTTALAGKVNTSAVGTANGVAELDNAGKVPSSQLPSYVDDVIEGYAKIVNPPRLGAVIAKLNTLAGSTINAGTYESGNAYNSIITKNANGKFNIYGIYANDHPFNTLIEFHGTASNFSIKNVSGEPCQTFQFMPENMNSNGTITNMSQGAIQDDHSWTGFDGSQGIWINTVTPIDISDFSGSLVNLDIPYVIAFYSDTSFTQAITPESGKIYVDLITDTSYRWSGTTYIAIGGSLVLGETSGSAYPGDKGKKATDSIGDLTQLETTNKSDLVSAINEVLENGGGEGQTIQYKVMPTASEELYGSKAIYQYIGETNANYTKGYFYKCSLDESNPSYGIATPAMTSNTAPSGTCSASSLNVDYEPAYMAFNQSNSGYPWICSNSDSSPWIKYEFPSGTTKHIRKIKVWNTNTDSWYPSSFKLQGSNDGTNWTDIKTCTLTNLAAGALNEFDIPENDYYNKFRLVLTKALQYAGFQRIDLMEITGGSYYWEQINVQPGSSGGDGTYLEKSITLSTSAATTVTFTDNSITNDSLYQVFTSIYGFEPTTVLISGTTCSISFPPYTSAASMTVGLLIKSKGV